MNDRSFTSGRIGRALAAGLLAAVLWAVIRPPSAAGCALVGRTTLTQIRAEEALIVWDAARHTEHFIRQANFQGERGEPFGFLVPTPAQPELAEVDESVFERLAALYRAPDPPRPRGRPSIDDLLSSPRPASAVEVVAVARVAGLDATVLRASDAAALSQWITQHGFSARPGLAQWLSGYVASGWYVTAFRYDGGGRPSFGSRAVRMTFHADRPVYPYSEPGDQPQGPARVLRVTVIGDTRMEGEVDGRRWEARTGYAARPNLASVLRGAVPAGAVARGAWMTTFEELASRRGARDLFFRPSAEQRAVPPSIVTRWALAHDESGSLGIPDRSEIRAAFAAASRAVRACGARRGGTAIVTVTFLHDGRTTDVSVLHMARGAVRDCIEATVRRIVLPPFRQRTFTVSYPYPLD